MKALAEILDGVAVSNPDVMHGTIVFIGTRVPVVNLLGHLASGEDLESFLCTFPGVSREQAEEFLTRLGSLISPEMFDLVPS
jgi:uncharacterized protein (DUF433 family)